MAEAVSEVGRGPSASGRFAVFGRHAMILRRHKRILVDMLGCFGPYIGRFEAL